MSDDWSFFIKGKYSMIDDKIKRKILNYFGKNNPNYTYVESYLFPEKYREDYAKMLGVDITLLEEAEELCDKPDMLKEELLIKVTNLENIKILD
jgi:hypothetical protein